MPESQTAEFVAPDGAESSDVMGPQEFMGHRLWPATFWWYGEMVDGEECSLCHRVCTTRDEMADAVGECDVEAEE